jgi:PadR family transcriptional regulator, regulatory protein PadR
MYLATQGTLWRMAGSGSLTSALRTGVLEYCVLALLADRELYGVELVRLLSDALGMATSEGTMYPLLSRLRRAGRITSNWRESPAGPPRRYYSLTTTGEAALALFRTEWINFRGGVDRLMRTDQP